MLEPTFETAPNFWINKLRYLDDNLLYLGYSIFAYYKKNFCEEKYHSWFI